MVTKSYELLIRSRYILYLGQVMSGSSTKYHHRSISHLSQLLIHFFRKRSKLLRRIFQHRVINLKNGKFTLSGDHFSSGLETRESRALGGFVLDQGNGRNIRISIISSIPASSRRRRQNYPASLIFR